MDVAQCKMVKQGFVILWQWLGVPLHEEDSLVPERTWPVSVDLELTSNVLGDDQLLRIVCNMVECEADGWGWFFRPFSMKLSM